MMSRGLVLEGRLLQAGLAERLHQTTTEEGLMPTVTHKVGHASPMTMMPTIEFLRNTWTIPTFETMTSISPATFRV
jgi:hypothetical protein